MKTNLQLFGGRGGGSGLGAGGGAGASGGQYGDRNSAEAQQYRRDLAELANANMSNSDLQAAVEAYAMTHKGVDEDEMLRNVREYKDFANHPDNLSPEARKMVEDAGLNLKQTTQTFSGYKKGYTEADFKRDAQIMETYGGIDFERSGSYYKDMQPEYEAARKRWRKQVEHNKKQS